MEEARQLNRAPDGAPRPGRGGGEYYRIVSEGRVKAYDGFNLPVACVQDGLDLNHNFPRVAPEEQLGAGRFSYQRTGGPRLRGIHKQASQTFVAASSSIRGRIIAAAIRNQGRFRDGPRICGYSDAGQKGEELTGYPPSASFTTSNTIRRKSSPARRTGCIPSSAHTPGSSRSGVRCATKGSDYKFIDWFHDHPVEDDLKLCGGAMRRTRARAMWTGILRPSGTRHG